MRKRLFVELCTLYVLGRGRGGGGGVRVAKKCRKLPPFFLCPSTADEKCIREIAFPFILSSLPFSLFLAPSKNERKREAKVKFSDLTAQYSSTVVRGGNRRVLGCCQSSCMSLPGSLPLSFSGKKKRDGLTSLSRKKGGVGGGGDSMPPSPFPLSPSL